jgi:hypothetical protein
MTAVHMRRAPTSNLAVAYLRTAEPIGKAGCAALDGRAWHWQLGGTLAGRSHHTWAPGQGLQPRRADARGGGQKVVAAAQDVGAVELVAHRRHRLGVCRGQGAFDELDATVLGATNCCQRTSDTPEPDSTLHFQMLETAGGVTTCKVEGADAPVHGVQEQQHVPQLAPRQRAADRRLGRDVRRRRVRLPAVLEVSHICVRLQTPLSMSWLKAVVDSRAIAGFSGLKLGILISCAPANLMALNTLTHGVVRTPTRVTVTCPHAGEEGGLGRQHLAVHRQLPVPDGQRHVGAPRKRLGHAPQVRQPLLVAGILQGAESRRDERHVGDEGEMNGMWEVHHFAHVAVAPLVQCHEAIRMKVACV